MRSSFPIAFLVALLPLAGAAQPPGGPAVATAAKGIALTIETLRKDAAAVPDARAARVAALYVPDGTPPTPFLPPGPFRAVWEGDLSLALRGDYAFSAAGRGTLTLTVNGEAAIEASGDDLALRPGKALRLNKGRNRLIARYESPATGDAWVRLFWSSEDFPAEPLPPDILSHDANAPALAAGRRLREGRELFAYGRCAKCHAWEVQGKSGLLGAEASAKAAPPAMIGMPEMALDAPSLADAGARFNEAWIALWMRDPRSFRPDTSMPALSLTPAEARDIAACLARAGLRAGEECPPEAPAPSAAAAGGRLFARLGCLGCHTLSDRADSATAGEPVPAPPGGAPVPVGRLPLRRLKAKWKPRALCEYLREPERHYAWTRMPNFKLTEDEAAKLAAFLLSRPVSDAPASPAAGPGEPPPPDPQRGAKLFVASGCANCHGGLARAGNGLPAQELRAVARPVSARGCLGADAASRGKAPDFGWTSERREALLAFLATDLSSLAREAPPEFAERRIRALRCVACHRRDGEEDAGSGFAEEADPLLAAAPPETAEEEAPYRVDQTRPPLTWVGEKLKPEWMGAFLAGALSYRPRPWLRAHMPAFPARAALLAAGLALEHGCPPSSPPDPAPDADLAEVGRRLCAKSGGFGCGSCHHIGSAAAVGVFEVMGVNFMRVKERLRKEYFHRWMRNPFRVEFGTKMPQYANDAGRTAYADVFEGDAAKQYEAIWHYLLAGEEITSPDR